MAPQSKRERIESYLKLWSDLAPEEQARYIQASSRILARSSDTCSIDDVLPGSDRIFNTDTLPQRLVKL